MSRQFDAKEAVLKAFPHDREAGVQLFLDYLDVTSTDFSYEEGKSVEEYIYGSVVPSSHPREVGK